MTDKIHESVQEYYGLTLASTADLQTNACCTLQKMPKHIAAALKNVADEVQDKYYGCGLCIPQKLAGVRLLDLGSGSGRDAYIAAQLVGESGCVVGVDMTVEQIAVANKYIEPQREKFGYAKSNVEFLLGNIEDLGALSLADDSFELIISNCVLNLAVDKLAVLKQAFRLLKTGGEFYFSDVYADRRIPQNLQDNPLLWGECLSGALYCNDFLKLARLAGFADPRAVESKPISVGNAELQALLGETQFFSVTYRLFKIAELETDCEDFGQAVRYKGTVAEAPHALVLDAHHHFTKGKIMPVCGNTYRMLADTRFRDDFDFFGDFSTHFGIFAGCGGAMPFKNNAEPNNSDSSNSSCC
jgi:ubiquinone/menaquinone biosynthesis C-methylase UbiE